MNFFKFRQSGLAHDVCVFVFQFSDGSTLTLDDDEAGGGERRDNDGFRRVSRPGNEDEEDAEVDFELDLPNLAATAANGFRDDDLPAMPIVLKKTRSSAAGAARTNAVSGYIHSAPFGSRFVHQVDPRYFM